MGCDYYLHKRLLIEYPDILQNVEFELDREPKYYEPNYNSDSDVEPEPIIIFYPKTKILYKNGTWLTNFIKNKYSDILSDYDTGFIRVSKYEYTTPR